MEEGILSFTGTVIGAFIAIAGTYFSQKQNYKLCQSEVWEEKRYELLKKVSELLDQLNLFTQNEQHPLNQLDKSDIKPEYAYMEWDSICELRNEIVPEIDILFDKETRKEFEELFEMVHEGTTKLENGKDIRDAISDFIRNTRKKYLKKEKGE